MHTFAAVLLSLLLPLPCADGWLGVYLDVEVEAPTVREVVPGSPAAAAGLRAGDLIVAIDDTATTTREAFVAAVRACGVGQQVRLRVARGGQDIELVATLGERPQETGAPPGTGTATRSGRPPVPAKPAAEPQPVAGGTRAYLGAAIREVDGALVVGRVIADSPAVKAGIEAGDQLVRFGARAVRTLADLDACMAAAKPGERIELAVRHGSEQRVLVAVLGTGPADRARPAAGSLPAPQADAASPFMTDFAAAERLADSSGRPLLVLYGAAWDGSSQAQRRALHDERLRELLAGFVCVYVDAERDRERMAARKVADLPTIEVAHDAVAWRHGGFLPVDTLRAKLAELAELAARADAPSEPAATGDPAPAPSAADMQAEVERLRAEIEQLRRALEELRQVQDGARDGGDRRTGVGRE